MRRSARAIGTLVRTRLEGNPLTESVRSAESTLHSCEMVHHDVEVLGDWLDRVDDHLRLRQLLVELASSHDPFPVELVPARDHPRAALNAGSMDLDVRADALDYGERSAVAIC